MAKLLKPTEAARLCGIAPSTWWRWEIKGITPKPVIRQGRIVRFAQSDILAFDKKLKEASK